MRRAQANPPVHRILASVPTGYPLNPAREWVRIIVPQATTNLFLNPSFETNTSNWTQSGNGSGSSLARSTTQQCRGAYAGALTIGTGGTYVQIVGPTIVSTTVYALSFHVRAPNGRPVALSDLLAVYNGTTNPFGRLEYIGNGWWRASVVFTATATTAPGLRVLGTAGQVWYTDACQIEASSVVTTYCDGDEQGLLPFESPPPFRWNGTPHASTSSRSAATRAGGIERPLDYYNLTLASIQGLGAGPVENVYTPLGNAPGAIYQTTESPERTFTLGGRFEASDLGLLSRKRGALRRDLSASLSGLAQPLRLILQKYRDTVAIGDQVYADCSYAGGLEGDDASLYSEDVAVQFVQYQPDLTRVVSQGIELGAATTLTPAYLYLRNALGTYSADTSFNGAIEPNALIYAPNGKFYLGGAFTTPGTRVVAYNPATSAFETLSTGLSGTVRALLYHPNGTLYAAGSFTIGPNSGAVASWNGSAWSIVGGASGLAGTCRALAYDATTDVVIAAGANGGNCVLSRWDGSSWTSYITTPTAGTIYDLAYDPRTRRTYVVGDFTNLDGNASSDRAAYVFNFALSNLSTGANSTIYSVTVDQASNVFVAGAFSTIGGITASGFAQWNGVLWSAMSGLTAAGSTPNYVRYDRFRDVVWCIAAGATLGSALTLLWKSGAITYPGTLGLINSPTPYGLNAVAASGDLVLFGRMDNDIDFPSDVNSVTGLTLQGSAAAQPVIVITSTLNNIVIFVLGTSALPQRQVQVRAAAPTFGRVTVDVANSRILNAEGDDITFGFAQSHSPDFALLPGANFISMFAENQSAVLYVYPRYLSLDDTVPGVE